MHWRMERLNINRYAAGPGSGLTLQSTPETEPLAKCLLEKILFLRLHY
jgi:hypothetical protein